MVQTSLIILTRNEITGLKAMIRKIPFEVCDEFFAVDYNSTDGTVEFFKKHHIPVIIQRQPGRAEAFYLGAKKAGGQNLIFFSPDGNENPADIPLLINKLKKGCDLVIASRFMPHSRNEEDDRIFKFRKWANQLFTLTANILWRGKVTDSINGYRAIRRNCFYRLNLDAKGFAIEYQMTIRALKTGIKIGEVPTIEGDRIGGASTSYAISTGWSFLRLLIKEIFTGKKFLKKQSAVRTNFRKIRDRPL